MEIFQSYNSDAVRIMILLKTQGTVVTIACDPISHQPLSILVTNSYGLKEYKELSWAVDPKLIPPTKLPLDEPSPSTPL